MNSDGEKKKLKIDLGMLAYAMEDASWEINYYLDLETGEVVYIRDETFRELEDIYQELYDPESEETVDLAEAIQARDLPEWRQEELLETARIDQAYQSRYISIPQGDSYEGYGDMEAFICTVEDRRLEERLWRAIRGRGAFRYFKDVLAGHPRERERWFAFKDEQMQQRVREWLESRGIEPVFEPRPEQSLPPVRPRFIEEVLQFVHKASRLSGVNRIALIGSLTTDEPQPKDADLLVTVTDQANLARLAKLGRQLNGHLQQLGRGGELFLADPQHNYLGRTCPWKQCGPGIRLSCDALHCGRRPYLHDDLEAIRLDRKLIAAPPIELWPRIVTRVAVPEDVQQGLLALLAKT